MSLAWRGSSRAICTRTRLSPSRTISAYAGRWRGWSASGRRPIDRDAQADRLKAKRRFPYVWLDDAQPNPAGSYVLKRLIDELTTTVLYGPSGCGKTAQAIDVACHIAAAMPWRGRRVRGGLVVYVAAEAGQSMLRRIAAWRDKHLAESREV